MRSCHSAWRVRGQKNFCPWCQWRVTTTQDRFGAELVKSSGGGTAINLDQTDIVVARLREG